jgi:hypothetical protein
MERGIEKVALEPDRPLRQTQLGQHITEAVEHLLLASERANVLCVR